jgi:energy-coupling factor transporter ATP-binding protein EcfA2
MDPEKITYFGETDSRGKRVKFGIKAKDRTRHVYVIGKTGMGKSTLLENMAIQDITSGNGMAFLDPHGKTADLLLSYVPPERLKDVVYFAPFDTEYPISFNILEDVGFDKRHLVVAGLMSTFKKIWVDAWSARMEYILTNTLLALIEYPGSTLLGVNRMLSDKDYRKKVVDNVKDPSVKSFWVDEFAKYTERQAAEAVPAIQNKVGQFTANPLIRNILGQSKSSFSIRQLMDERKILIVNLSKGLVGESNANLLGSMIITKIYLAAMSRADVQEKELKKLPNFYLFVDEFQSFANESFADILSEARKYNLNLTIAHQYIEQMSEEVRSAVFGNVGTMMTFRVGAFDAEVLEKEFAPQFTAEDLVNLGIFQMYLKLMINGVSSVPFSSSSLPPIPEPVISYKSEIINLSRKQFAQPRMVVEKDIQDWHNEGKDKTGWEKKQEKVGKDTSQAKLFNGASGKRPFLKEESSTGKGEALGSFEQAKKPNYSSNESGKRSLLGEESATGKGEILRSFQQVKKPQVIPVIQQKQSVHKPVVMPVSLGNIEEVKNSDKKEKEDDFLPLKAVAPKIIADSKRVEEVLKQNKTQEVKPQFSKTIQPINNKKDGKVMTKENLSALQSALQSVLKKTDDKKEVTHTEIKQDTRNEELKKEEIKNPEIQNHKNDQPDSSELKKVLGVE